MKTVFLEVADPVWCQNTIDGIVPVFPKSVHGDAQSLDAPAEPRTERVSTVAVTAPLRPGPTVAMLSR